MKKILAAILILLLVAGGVMLLKKRRDAIVDIPVAGKPVLTVQTVHAETGKVQDLRTFLARLEARDSALLSTKLSGQIVEVQVSENQRVGKGDLLMKIDDGEIAATIESLAVTLASLQYDLQFSQHQFETNQEIFAAGGLSKEKLDASQAAMQSRKALLDSTRQRMKALEAQRSYLNIKAPFAGTVGTIYLGRGDFATPGKVLLTVNSPDQKLTFTYVEREGRPVKTGQDVLLHGQKIGTIHTLYDDAVNGLGVAEVALQDALDLPKGSNLTIDVVVRLETGCSLPVDALLHRKDGVSVMAYNGKIFEAVPVTVTVEGGGSALIDPCIAAPVAVAAETKLGLLPGLDNIKVTSAGPYEQQLD